MTHEQLVDSVRALLAEHLTIEPAKVTESTTLDDLGADSLDRVEIIMKLEDTFDIEISDDDAETLTSVDQIVSYIERKQNKQPN